MRLQSNNLDDDLHRQGLTSVNSVKKVFDFNGSRSADRCWRIALWFFAAARRWGTTTGVANLFADTSVSDFIYTPDSGRPIEPEESNKGVGGRLTFQATSKDKFTFSCDKQRNFQDQLTGQLETGTIKNEGNPGYCQRHEVIAGHVEPAAVEQPALRRRRDGEQVQLRRLRRGPVPERLRRLRRTARRTTCRSTTPASASPTTASASGTMSLSHQSNGRFNVSFITRPAQHQDRRVLDVRSGRRAPHLHDARADAGQRAAGVVHLLQRRPASLTQFASPNLQVDQLNPDLGCSCRTSG